MRYAGNKKENAKKYYTYYREAYAHTKANKPQYYQQHAEDKEPSPVKLEIHEITRSRLNTICHTIYPAYIQRLIIYYYNTPGEASFLNQRNYAKYVFASPVPSVIQGTVQGGIMKRIIFLSLLISAQLTAASALQITEFDAQKIPKTATLGTTVLKRVGTGIRQKKVLFVNVNVYRATLFAPGPLTSPDPKLTPLDVLVTKPCALQLNLLRALSAADILKSFEAALKINDVKDSPALSQFKTAIKNGGNVAKGQNVTISIDITDKGDAVLTVEQGSNITEIKGNHQLAKDVLSIWFGKPADAGLAALKEQLTKG